MKKMTKVISLALALVMCLALCACGQKDNGDTAADGKKTFVMGVDPEYPPFSYLGDDGKYTGFDVEIAQAACDLLGWDLQVFGVNWDQKLVQLDAKECDCVWSGMTILDSMKDAGYVLSKPYYDNTQVIMVKAATSSPPRIWPARTWPCSWAPPASPSCPRAATLRVWPRPSASSRPVTASSSASPSWAAAPWTP